jgi:hypothetical protein
MREGRPIEYLNIRLHPGDWDKLRAALKADGYDETPEGVYEFLFDIVDEERVNESNTKEEADEEPQANPAIDKLFNYIKDNPEALKGAAGLGKSVLSALLKKKMGL